MNGRLTTIFLSVVVALAVVGFFIGIGDGVPHPAGMWTIPDGHSSRIGEHASREHADNPKVIPAVSYAQISSTAMGPTSLWQAQTQALPTPQHDLFAEVKPNEADKQASSQVRAERRAFNGAPPVIPHPVENTADAACYACHGQGVQLAGLKASVMSHAFLANCTQCHAPMAPAPFREVDASVQSSFVGLPAPANGQRAFPGAPPTVPHSTWMRENCLACHGNGNGWAGMESTHPWRSNCVQCHAPSAELEQGISTEVVPMLPPLDVASQ